MDELKAYVKQGETVALLGSSGVGNQRSSTFSEGRQASRPIRS
ncbi:hypothetical protein PO124_10645 [Bacillus licheniformis]|nr:hypothetical protein [Bacillus licheniformis]